MIKRIMITIGILIIATTAAIADGPHPGGAFERMEEVYGETSGWLNNAFIIEELACEDWGGRGPEQFSLYTYQTEYKIIAVGDGYSIEDVNITVFTKDNEVIAVNTEVDDYAIVNFTGIGEEVIVMISGVEDDYIGAVGILIYTVY